eukprot:scaffold188364_cov22-Tisochrysis_lutea.AAC.3
MIANCICDGILDKPQVCSSQVPSKTSLCCCCCMQVGAQCTSVPYSCDIQKQARAYVHAHTHARAHANTHTHTQCHTQCHTHPYLQTHIHAQVASPAVAARLNVTDGALVQLVVPGGAAQRAGLLPTRRGLTGIITGDVIKEMLPAGHVDLLVGTQAMMQAQDFKMSHQLCRKCESL